MRGITPILAFPLKGRTGYFQSRVPLPRKGYAQDKLREAIPPYFNEIASSRRPSQWQWGDTVLEPGLTIPPNPDCFMLTVLYWKSLGGGSN